MSKILQHINSPDDLKTLNQEQLLLLDKSQIRLGREGKSLTRIKKLN